MYLLKNHTPVSTKKANVLCLCSPQQGPSQHPFTLTWKSLSGPLPRYYVPTPQDPVVIGTAASCPTPPGEMSVGRRSRISSVIMSSPCLRTSHRAMKAELTDRVCH